MRKDLKGFIAFALIGLCGNLAIGCADSEYVGAEGSESSAPCVECAPEVMHSQFEFYKNEERSYGYVTYSYSNDTTYFITFEAVNKHGEVIGIDSLRISKGFYMLLDESVIRHFYAHEKNGELLLDSAIFRYTITE